jgi:TetR/AcrR family transcriptional regulator, ethionamide resistance regulator
MSRESRRQLPNRAARRADTLRVLAEAAATCAERDGISFAELSVERLTTCAEMSRAGFYLYFEDKGELVRAWHREFDAATVEILTQWWDATKPATDDIERMLHQLADIHRAGRIIIEAVKSMTALDPDLRCEQVKGFVLRRSQLGQHIVRGQREKWIDPELEPDTTAAWLTSMVDHVMVQVIPRQDDLTSLLATGTDIICRTLYSIP